MNKMYKFIPKNFMKPKIPYIIQYKRFSSHNEKKNHNYEFCFDVLFFMTGMWCGYMIGKDNRKRIN